MRAIKCLVLAAGFGLCHLAAQKQPPPAPGTPMDATQPGSYSSFPELMQLKRWKEVAALAEELHQKNSTDPRALYWLGMSRLQLHDPIAAAQALRSAERLGLNTALAHEGQGLAYYDLNQFHLFEEQMEKSAQLDRTDPKPHYYLGLYQWTIRSDAVGALEQFEKAIELAPDDWKSVFQAGNCLEQLGKLNQARDQYRRAISLVEKRSVSFGWPYQGMARLVLDDQPEMALDYAKRAADLEPGEYSNHLLLAKIYERLGKLDEAIREAKIAAEANPNDSSTRYTLYKMYREAGDPHAAGELKLFQEITAVYGQD